MPIRPARFLGANLNPITHGRAFALSALVIAVLLGVGVVVLRKTPLCARMLAIRSNERGATATGISAARTKLIAFMLAGFIAGIGGSLEAYQQVQVNWTSFGFTFSLFLVGYAYLGGITSISGAIATALLLAGGIVSGLFNFQGEREQVFDLIAAAGVIAMVLAHPEGIGAVPRQIVGAMARVRGARRPEPGPGSLTPDVPPSSPEPPALHPRVVSR